MKRNWDTIREILIRLEEMPPEKQCLELADFPSVRAYEYSYHVEILMEAGLIDGQMCKTIGPQADGFLAMRMTWAGHEFLDAIRNDNLWKKAKDSFVKEGLAMTFDLVKSVAKDIAVGYLKSTVGGA